MKRALLILFMGLASAQLLLQPNKLPSAHAQSIPFPGPGAASVASYQGPGDVFSGATLWGSCARVYSAAQASTATSLCDLVAVTGGAAVCTLRGSSTGFVDLAASYCAGTTPSAACAAASGGSCKISKVYDQTGNGNHLTQGTLANMPALAFNSTPTGTLPAMQCTGGTCLLVTTSTFNVTTFTAASVYQRTAVTAFSTIGSGTSGEAYVGGGTVANKALVTSGTQVNSTASANDSAWNAIQGLIASGACAIGVNGTDQTGMVCGSTGIVSHTMRTMRSPQGDQLTGYIVETGYWPLSSNATDRGNLNTNAHGTNGYNF